MISFLRILGLLAGSALLASARPATLLDDMRGEIDSRLAAARPGPALLLFFQADDRAGVYVRNPGVWTGGIDLSAIGVHSPSGGNGSKQTGTLITPADILVASHFKFNVGDHCVFVDNHNVAYYATISAFLGLTRDLTVEHVTWRGKVPATLKVLPILPPDFRRYAPDGVFKDFPVLCHQSKPPASSSRTPPGPTRSCRDLPSFPREGAEPRPFFLSAHHGDSSQPVMAVIRGTAVLLTCNSTAFTGISCPDSFADINRALAAMGSRWQATAADLRGFPTF